MARHRWAGPNRCAETTTYGRATHTSPGHEIAPLRCGNTVNPGPLAPHVPLRIAAFDDRRNGQPAVRAQCGDAIGLAGDRGRRVALEPPQVPGQAPDEHAAHVVDRRRGAPAWPWRVAGTSDPELTSEDIALGYKQLLERQPRLRREVVAG